MQCSIVIVTLWCHVTHHNIIGIYDLKHHTQNNYIKRLMSLCCIAFLIVMLSAIILSVAWPQVGCATPLRFLKLGPFPASFSDLFFINFSYAIQYYLVIICPLVMLPYPPR